MDDDINITGWTGAEEKPVTLGRAQTHNTSKRRRRRSVTVFYSGETLFCLVPFIPQTHLADACRNRTVSDATVTR